MFSTLRSFLIKRWAYLIKQSMIWVAWRAIYVVDACKTFLHSIIQQITIARNTRVPRYTSVCYYLVSGQQRGIIMQSPDKPSLLLHIRLWYRSALILVSGVLQQRGINNESPDKPSLLFTRLLPLWCRYYMLPYIISVLASAIFKIKYLKNG